MSKKSDNSIDVVDLLPNDKDKLARIANEVRALDAEIKELNVRRSLTPEVRRQYKEKLTAILNQVGDYSMPAFEIRNELEKKYRTLYGKDYPKYKNLFLTHYSNIHEPYDRLKNSIWKLLEKTTKKK